MSRDLLFWDVDTQRDFLEPGGKLYVPGAENLIRNLYRLTHGAAQNRILLVSSVDAHQPDDPEFHQYPPHCLVGTPGQRKVPETLLPNPYTIPNQPVSLPDDLLSHSQIIIEKQDVNVFTNPNVDDLLTRLGPTPEILLYGVVTEICVDHAARGLIERGYRVHLVRDAIQHLEVNLARLTIEEVQKRDGKILTTDDVLELIHPAAA
jgi:nicotinamidase/pyrazinamidase